MTASPIGVGLSAGPRVEGGLIAWLAVFAFSAFCLAFAGSLPWVAAYPPDWILPAAALVNIVTDWVVQNFPAGR